MDILLFGLIVIYAVILWRYTSRKLAGKIGILAARSVATLAGPLMALVIAVPLIPSEGESASIWALLFGFVIATALSFLEPSMQERYQKIKAEEEEKEKRKLKGSNLNYRPNLQRASADHLSVEVDNELNENEDVIGSISFSYENANGDASDREVDIFAVDDDYFEGFCHLAGGERTFRMDRIVGDVIDLDTGQLINPKEYFWKLSALT